MDTDWDLGRPVSPSAYRHTSNFSSQSLFSISSNGSDINLTVPSTGLSRTNVHRKPPKYRMQKLIKSSLKHTLKSTNKSESINIEYWETFYKKLRRIIKSFSDSFQLYDALNDPYSSKSSNKTCSSIIHILCKQFYLYCRSNNWSVCFKIYDCISYILSKGANTSIYYTKLNETAQKNYNSIHTLYQGLYIMFSCEVITQKQFVNYFCLAISSGSEYNHNAFIYNLYDSASNSILSEEIETESNTSFSSFTPSIINEQQILGAETIEFNPSILTLCIYRIENEYNEYEWQNITYWLGDCCYNDYYVYLISPCLIKSFILMGYNLLNIIPKKINLFRL